MEDHRVTSEQLKISLELADINVHASVIRKTLSNNGVHDTVARKMSRGQTRPILLGPDFAASGPGQLPVIDGTMNSALHQQITKRKYQDSCPWTSSHESCSKTTMLSTQVFYQRTVKEDLNPVLMLWRDDGSQRVINGSRKHLVAVIAPKRAHTRYWTERFTNFYVILNHFHHKRLSESFLSH